MPLSTDAIDLLLVDGDLDYSTGDLSFVRGQAGIAQAVGVAIGSFAGEWFADLDSGMTWFQDVFDVRYDEPRVRSALRRVILAVDGVAEVLTLELTFTGATRALRVNWQVRAALGDTLTGSTEVSI